MADNFICLSQYPAHHWREIDGLAVCLRCHATSIEIFTTQPFGYAPGMGAKAIGSKYIIKNLNPKRSREACESFTR